MKMAKEQSNKMKNYCKFCKKTIVGSSFKFKSHLYLHNAVKPRFKCKYCMKGYYRHDLFTRHINTHENIKKPSKNIFICDYCDRSYVDKRNLITHLKIHDDTIPTLIKFTCKACKLNFCEKRILLNHIRRVHFNQKNTNEPVHVERKINESWLEAVVQTDICVQMTKVNNNILRIKKHGMIKRETTKQNGQHLGQHLSQRIDQHLDKTLGKRLDQRSNKRADKNSILQTDNYTTYSKAVCDYCNKEMLKKSIQNHIRERHLNDRRFKCLDCKRSFHRRYQLADHICKGSKELTSKRLQGV